MGRRYSKDEIESMVETIANNKELLYKADCIDYRGTLKGKKEYTSEAIAAYLLSHLSRLASGIKHMRRESTYNVEHANKPRAENSNRQEELLAIQLVEERHTGSRYGTMIAYQIPLKNSMDNRGVGKIDLISYHDECNKLFIHEFKKKDNDETLLRSVLEIYTYFKTVNQEKLLVDFGHCGAIVVPSVLVYAESEQHKHYQNNSNLKALMKKLGVEFHILEEPEHDPA